MLPCGRVRFDSDAANSAAKERRFLLKHRGSADNRKLSNTSLRQLRKLSEQAKTALSLDHSKPLPIEFLKLNVGGQSFRLLTHSLSRGLLHDLAQLEHNSRLTLCDGFIPETDEYFFQRSSLMFDGIYQFYVGGQCHRPPGVCLEQFSAELDFWGLTELQLSSCCWHLNLGEAAVPTAIEKSQIDPFQKIRCGKLRRKVWHVIEVPRSSVFAYIFSFVSVAAILISNVALVLSSLKEFQIETNISKANSTVLVSTPHHGLSYIEFICIVWFSIEYCLRILVTADRKRTCCQVLNIIDLVAIVPFYVEFTLYSVGLDAAKLDELRGAMMVIRILRVLRVIRLFKLGRYSSGLRAFANTMNKSKEQLGMLLVVLATGIMFFSTLVYYLEKDEPDTKFKTIPDGAWWCIVTMTTVGYGDMFPITLPGKLVGSCCIASGILVLALPITVIVENFMKVQEEIDGLQEC